MIFRFRAWAETIEMMAQIPKCDGPRKGFFLILGIADINAEIADKARKIADISAKTADISCKVADIMQEIADIFNHRSPI